MANFTIFITNSEIFKFLMPFDLLDGIDHKSSEKWNNLFSNPIIDENTYDMHGIKHLRKPNPWRVIIGHIK